MCLVLCLAELQWADSWHHSRNIVQRLRQCYSAHSESLCCKCNTLRQTHTHPRLGSVQGDDMYLLSHTLSESYVQLSQSLSKNSTVAEKWSWPNVEDSWLCFTVSVLFSIIMKKLFNMKERSLIFIISPGWNFSVFTGVVHTVTSLHPNKHCVLAYM